MNLPPRPARPILTILLAFGLVLGAAAAFAPQIFWEYANVAEPHVIITPSAVKIARGRMFDDYWSVEEIAPNTFAIGEPRYYQQNYSYLVLGRDRAVMLDAGTGNRDIRPVLRSLTTLPLTVIPSHLHFDHTGGLGAFEHIAMLDLPALRAEAKGDRFRPTRYQFLGAYDHLREPTWRVEAWWRPQSSIDLGGRKVQVLSTPGHTPSGVSLYDAGNRMLFTGDYIYPTTLYAFLPGASLSAYRATARRLLATLPADTTLWTAHCCRAGEDAAAPWLSMSDLKDLSAALDKLDRGELKGTGVYPVGHPVNRQMTLATGWAFNNR